MPFSISYVIRACAFTLLGSFLLTGCSGAPSLPTANAPPTSNPSPPTPSEGGPPDATAKTATWVAKNQPIGGEVVILAAASTREAISELAEQFSDATGTKVKISADDSGRLAQQIIAGAPADLFLSASEKWTLAVADERLVARQLPLLGNRLVVVRLADTEPKAEADTRLKLENLADFPDARLAIAGPTVPAGMYGRQALEHHGWLAKLESRRQLAIGENVRAVLAFVEQGEAELGIVYSTDALLSKKVVVASTFDETSHQKIVYPLALLKAGETHPAAIKFYDYLASKEALAVFKKFGFIVHESN